MNRTIASLTVVAVFAAADAAQAQHHHHGGYHFGGMPFVMPVQPAFNPGLVCQQMGQAAVQWEQARGMYIQNMVRLDQHLVQQDQERKEARAQIFAARREATLQQRLARQERRQSTQAKEATNKRSEFRSTTNALRADGTINWPTVLRGDEYKAQREQLEALVAQRAATSSARLEVDDSRQVELSCKELLAELTRHARDANSNDWITARRFVESFACTARHPATQGQLASR